MLRSVRFLTTVMCFLAAASVGRAALDPALAPSAAGTFELLVVEVSGCLYCGLFRRDVLPLYKASERARTVPIRFADLNHADLSALRLQGPVDTVPTVIVLNRKEEVGRIAGYVGPETFFHAINRLLAGGP